MRQQTRRAGLVVVCAVALLACDRGSQGSGPDGNAAPAIAQTVETQWTKSAAERNDQLVAAALKEDPQNGGLRYALPELRIYDRRQRLIYHVNGAAPGKTADILNRVISAGEEVAGPSFQQTLADLETADRQPASNRVRPGDHVTVFDYWAEWCVPCKALEKELLDWAAGQPKGSVQIVRAEADPMKLARAKGDKIIMMKKDASGKLIRQEVN